MNVHKINNLIQNVVVEKGSNATGTAWVLVRMISLFDKSYTNSTAKMCFWRVCMKRAYALHAPKQVSQLRAKPAAMELKQALSLKESRSEIQEILDRVPQVTLSFSAGRPFPVYETTKKIAAKLYNRFSGSYVGTLMLEKQIDGNGYNYWVKDSRLDSQTLKNLEIDLGFLWKS